MESEFWDSDCRMLMHVYAQNFSVFSLNFFLKKSAKLLPLIQMSEVGFNVVARNE